MSSNRCGLQINARSREIMSKGERGGSATTMARLTKNTASYASKKRQAGDLKEVVVYRGWSRHIEVSPMLARLLVARTPTGACIDNRHARTHFVCKYQSCMFSNVGLIVRRAVHPCRQHRPGSACASHKWRDDGVWGQSGRTRPECLPHEEQTAVPTKSEIARYDTVRCGPLCLTLQSPDGILCRPVRSKPLKEEESRVSLRRQVKSLSAQVETLKAQVRVDIIGHARINI